MKKHQPIKKISDTNQRYPRIDLLRGFAMLWMTVFHFCFDLNHFGFLNQNFYIDSFWTLQRVFIVSLFLTCAGLSQAVAFQFNLTPARFWKRWREVAVAALLVTISSYFVYPQSFIYFGILHGVALMLILLRWLRTWNYGFVTLGGFILGLHLLSEKIITSLPTLAVFNSKVLNWIGFINEKPITEDYAPLIPWFSVVLMAYFLGKKMRDSKILSGEINPLFEKIALLGRYSLSYYLIHQPVLFGLTYLASRIFN